MKFSRNTDLKVRASVDLTPLIDVVFQLLIFFMLASTFVVHNAVPVDLPEVAGSDRMEDKEMSITLSYSDKCSVCTEGEDGETYIDDVPISNWTQLTRKLTELRDSSPEATVIIRPDKRVSSERLIKVLGFITEIGIKHYAIAAAPPEESE